MASKTVIRPIDLSFTDSNVVNSKQSVLLRHPIKTVKVTTTKWNGHLQESPLLKTELTEKQNGYYWKVVAYTKCMVAKKSGSRLEYAKWSLTRVVG